MLVIFQQEGIRLHRNGKSCGKEINRRMEALPFSPM